MDTVSLGERPAGSPDAPGEITLTFDEPLRNRPGCDLVVFENAFPSSGGVFGELGFVEVSSDGETWARFPSVSLTPGQVGRYGVIDPTDVYNLAGKFQNAYGVALGSPFNFDELAADEAVIDGAVDLDDIRFVKIVDIPGAGDYFDAADKLGYDAPHPIYDEHPTIGSAGFDVEAVGAMDESQASSDDDDQGDDDNDDESPWRDDDAASGAAGDSGSPGCA
jgi:hypothetical protein